MNKDEALKLALEAIQELRYSSSTFKADKLSAAAITAIEQALAQPAQEPVAAIYISQSGEREFDDWKCKLPIGQNILYTAPPAAQPVQRILSGQELIEYQSKHKLESEEYMAALNKYLPVIGVLAQIESKNEACTDERMCVPCYTGQGTCEATPPAAQRPWVGLTDEQYDEIWRMDLNNRELMDKTIAALKEKNT